MDVILAFIRSSLALLSNKTPGRDVINVNFVYDRAFKSATQDDLWEALTEEAHRVGVLAPNMNVKQIMDTWTLQTGFPLITVTRNYEDRTALVSQVREYLFLVVGWA